ncbi:Hypothetical protein, putative [Bodo saltans]|uniref:FHA domain-containing protein n=1 Tax=Bodo saltans TaxID=75058 RepID=A0A0S4IW39_BODSA|nr:Hypothetical protein, putative [Bodo saltans]|eukprot:CUG05785.1 Hypothetical protein, putative [Bodo saltans]
MSKRLAAAWQVVKTMPTTGGEVGVFDLHPGMTLTIGRGAELSEFSRVDHKYISRAHVCLRLATDGATGAQRVVIQQLGKNPTLIGPSATRLCPAAVDAGASSTSSETVNITSEVAAAASQAYGHAHSIGVTTLHFPSELKFPQFHILFLAPTVATASVVAPTTSATVADEALAERDATLKKKMTRNCADGVRRDALKVVVDVVDACASCFVNENAELPVQKPTRMMTMAVRDVDSDDDDVQPPPARQTKLLDEALRQQAIANAADASRAKEVASWIAPKATPPSAVIAPLAVVAAAARGSSSNRTPSSSSATEEKPAPLVIATVPDLPRRLPGAPAPPRILTDSEESLPLAQWVVVPPPAASYASAEPSPPATRGVAQTAVSSPKPATPAPPVGGAMGMWEWKCHVEGDDNDPKNWRKYPKATADVLEAAFRKNGGKVPWVSIDMTYRVCFDDSRIGMAQYRCDDPARWRAVRRRGGGSVPRPNAKKKAILRDTGFSSASSSSSDTSSESDDDDDKRPSWIVSDDSDDESSTEDSDSDVSFDTESSIETESSDRRKKKKNKKGAKTTTKKKHPTPKKRPRDD